jgi:arsenite-transporting ATPase
VASADAAHSLGDVFEIRVGPEPREIAPRLDAIEIDARVEMARHWGRIRDFLVATFEHQGIDGVVADEMALLPGAEELATLLAVERFVQEGRYDLVILDCAPTDSTLRLATLPDVAHGALRVLLPLLRTLAGVVTPIARAVTSLPLPGSEVFRDADELLHQNLRALQRRITDEETSVRIVVTPERMVIDEARRAHTELALFEVPCDAVVMNRLLPADAAREDFFRDWGRLQEQRCREVESWFAPLPVLRAPLQADEVTGIARLGELGETLFDGVEPDAVLSRAPRVRFGRDAGDYVVRVPLPGAEREGLDVAVIEDDLVVTTGLRRRAIALPRRMAGLELARARLEAGWLVVRLARPTNAERA